MYAHFHSFELPNDDRHKIQIKCPLFSTNNPQQKKNTQNQKIANVKYEQRILAMDEFEATNEKKKRKKRETGY